MAYNVTITNGTGTQIVQQGNYSVTAEVPGYDNASISPKNISVTADTTDFDFTISANGTLTIHVTEDGTSTGTPVVGATFYRTDAQGTTYGSPVTTDATGNAQLPNVPFAATGAPDVYYIQTASDEQHNFDNTVKSVALTSQTQTVEVTNTAAAAQTVNLTDSNYDGLPVENGTITLN